VGTEELLKSPVALLFGVVTVALSIFVLGPGEAYHRRLALHPFSFVRGERRYTLLTSGLIHADVTHLLFNMITFYFFAFYLEARLGHWQFGLLYLVALLASDVRTIFKERNNPHYWTLGASGAVTAVIFSFIIYEPTARIAFFFIPIGIPAPIFAVIYIAVSYYGTRSNHGHINHEAHLWGAITGLAMTALLDPGAYAGFWRAVFGAAG